MKRNESVACVILNYNDVNTTISLVKKSKSMSPLIILLLLIIAQRMIPW